ncbi:Response regulator of zinc sigma-54-dependent two-component system, partial [hydrothermal vent metagenome]
EIERVGGKETIKIDIRVIASTKKDLKQLVNEGKFREDLYYRLSVFPLSIPPLRERKQDIPLLFKSFLSRFSNNSKYFVTEKAYEIIMNYDFPGNARELRNLSERLVLITPATTIDVKNIPVEIKYPARNILCANFENRSLNEIVEEIEKSAIVQAMEKSGGNKAKAAVRLGIPASTLKSKIYKYGLD